jgi:iron complex transport system substrate-binding protein
MHYNGITRRGVVVGGLSAILLADGFAVARPASAQEGEGPATDPVVFGATPSADGAEITVTHAQGETSISGNPAKVIAFDMASVDTLTTLGVTIAGLPKGNPFTGMFEQFNDDAYEHVGTLFEPDYEAVAALDPDLIIVANRSAAVFPELAKLAPTIDMTGQTGEVIGDLRASVGILSAIFGTQAEGEAALAQIDEKVAALQAGVQHDATALVIMTSGGSVTAVAPGGVRGGLIYNTLGLKPPVDDLEAVTHGEAISFEFLLEHNADWLFVIDRDAAIGTEDAQAAQEVLDNAIVHETTAHQNGQIVYLNGYDWYVVMSGITTVNNMLDQLAPVAGLV